MILFSLISFVLGRFNSIDSTVHVNLTGVDFNPNIPQPIYRDPSQLTESPDHSLTRSQVLGVINKEEPFEIDKEWIRTDFEALYNKDKRDWYFSTFSKEETKEYIYTHTESVSGDSSEKMGILMTAVRLKLMTHIMLLITRSHVIFN